jgi:hypothetical protein
MANEAIAKPTPAYMRDLETIETEAAATRYGALVQRQELERKQQELEQRRVQDLQIVEVKRRQRVEQVTTEGLQVLASMGAGAIANVKVGNVQLGPALNFLLGAAAKVAIVSDVDSVPLRVLAQTGKTLLHTQLGIWTRDALRGVP